MSGGLISNNTSEIAGCGVAVEGTSILAINCGTIEGNSSFSGGGMFVDVKSKIIEPKEKPYLLGFSSYTRYNENK